MQFTARRFANSVAASSASSAAAAAASSSSKAKGTDGFAGAAAADADPIGLPIEPNSEGPVLLGKIIRFFLSRRKRLPFIEGPLPPFRLVTLCLPAEPSSAA